MRSLILSCLAFYIILKIHSSRCALRDVFSWKNFTVRYIDEERQFPTQRELDNRVADLTDFAVWGHKLFLSLSSRSPETPITLTYVNLNDSLQTVSPHLTPYPRGIIDEPRDMGPKVHKIKNLQVDFCDRLWALGEENIPTGGTRTRILVWDLKADILLRDHPIDMVSTGFAVDVTKRNCSAAFAFILQEFKITVYDFQSDESWHSNTNLDLIRSHVQPKSCTRTSRLLNKATTSDMDFITLLAPMRSGHRRIFFRSKISDGHYITTSKTIRKKHGADAYDFFWHIGCETAGESFNSVFDEGTGVFFHTSDGNGRNISCWNSNKYPVELSSKTSAILPVNEFDHHLKRMKVDQSGNLWFLFSHDDNQNGQNGKANGNGLNFKFLTIPIAEIIKGTVCEAA